MFPFRDHNPSGRVPYVTWGLIAANVLIFLLMLPLQGDQYALASFYDDWAAVPVQVVNGVDTQTLVTSMFLHAGFMHLAGNMLFLWIYGDNIEDTLGHVWFLIFYLVCGVAATLAHIMIDPNSNVPLVGASGAIAGVMGAYLLMFPRAKIDLLLILIVYFRVFTLPAFVVLGFWMVMQTFGVLGSTGEGGGVAYWAHIGGFVVGIILMLPIWLRAGGSDYWQKTEYHPPHKPTFEEVKTSIPMVTRRK